MVQDNEKQIDKSVLAEMGWVEKAGWMVRYGAPRLGWMGGRLVIGYRDFPERVTTISQLEKIMTDVDKCPGTGCPLAKTCWRFREYKGDPFAMTPLNVGDTCIMYKQVEFYGQ